MGEMSEVERQQAAREARDAIVSRPAGASTSAREAAMRRYLGAEQYHELRQEQGRSQDEPQDVPQDVTQDVTQDDRATDSGSGDSLDS
jgi:hypothetical protein